jgi:enoyl-CoA hydratase
MAYVSVAGTDGVAVLTIDKPPANALDLDLLAEIIEAVEGVAADPPRAVVLAGRDGFFSAGIDLKAIPTYSPSEHREVIERINAMALGVYGLSCPVVAAITGHAIAGGMVLALGADIRVASNAGRYGLTEIRVGVPFPQAAIGLVRAEMPPHAARVLAFGNQLVEGSECQRLGVFDEVLEPGAVLPRATELAHELAAFPQDTYALTKRELRGDTLARLRAAAANDPLLLQ